MSDSREGLLWQVATGDLPPEEAEDIAQDSGMAPLATNPPDDWFNPRLHAMWTLEMAAAWIADRSFTSVQKFSDEYRAHRLVWVPEGRGHVLRPPETAASQLMRGTRAKGEMPKAGWKNRSGFQGAIWLLWSALTAGDLHAVCQVDGEIEAITPDIWSDLRWRIDSRAGDVALRRSSADQPAYRNVLVAAADVWRLWPSPERRPASLPEVVRPDGAGSMTLFHAALWIATRGGSITFDPADGAIWTPAFKVLTDRIADGEVEVSGVKNERRCLTPRELFIGMRVSYPSGTTGLWFEKRPHLCSNIYLGEEAWEDGHCDSIQGPNGTLWTELLVAKRDVREHWPFTLLPDPVTGAPGRPSKSMDLIRQEFDRRAEAGETLHGLREEARALLAWLVQTHPERPRPTVKTIENNIRPIFRTVQQPRN